MVTFDQPIQLSQDTFFLSWTSDQAISLSNPYRVYEDGILVSTQIGNSYTVRAYNGACPVIEVLDQVDAVPAPAFPPNLVFGWQGDSDAYSYKVEVDQGAGFVEVETFLNDPAASWMSYSTGTLADETTHTWRITPIDAAGNEGTSVTFVTLLVRYPTPPDVNFTYNGSGAGTVTISAA